MYSFHLTTVGAVLHTLLARYARKTDFEPKEVPP